MKAVNLLPSDARPRGGLSFKPRPAHAVALILLALALMAVAYGQARNNAAHAESEAIVVRDETAAVERSSAVDAAAAATVPTFERYIAGVSKVTTYRYGWGPLFHALGVTVPSRVQFTSLTMNLGASSGTASAASASTANEGLAQPQSATMVLKGCSYGQYEVATLMRGLRRVPDVSEVSLIQSTMGASRTAGSGASSSASTGGCPASGPTFEVNVAVAAPKPWTGAPVTRAVTSSQAAAAARAKAKQGAGR